MELLKPKNCEFGLKSCLILYKSKGNNQDQMLKFWLKVPVLRGPQIQCSGNTVKSNADID